MRKTPRLSRRQPQRRLRIPHPRAHAKATGHGSAPSQAPASPSATPEGSSLDGDEAALWKSATAMSSIVDVEHNFCWVFNEDFVPGQDEFENRRTKDRLRARKADL